MDYAASVPRQFEAFQIRCFVRDPEKLQARYTHPRSCRRVTRTREAARYTDRYMDPENRYTDPEKLHVTRTPRTVTRTPRSCTLHGPREAARYADRYTDPENRYTDPEKLHRVSRVA